MDTNITPPINCTFSSVNLTSFPVRTDALIVFDICSSPSIVIYYWIIVSLCLFFISLSLIYIIFQIISISKRKGYFKLFSAICAFLFQLTRLIIFIDWRGFRGVFSPLWTYLFSQVSYGVLLGGATIVVLYWIILIFKSKKLGTNFIKVKRNILIVVLILMCIFMITEGVLIGLASEIEKEWLDYFCKSDAFDCLYFILCGVAYLCLCFGLSES